MNLKYKYDIKYLIIITHKPSGNSSYCLHIHINHDSSFMIYVQSQFHIPTGNKSTSKIQNAKNIEQ